MVAKTDITGDVNLSSLGARGLADLGWHLLTA
jgi:hypothetical protein